MRGADCPGATVSCSLERSMEAKSLADGTKERQKSYRQSAQQPRAVAALRQTDADLFHAHAKVRILGIAKAAFDARRIFQQDPRLFISEARRQIPRLPYVLA